MAICRGRLAGRLRTRRPRLDRGAGHAGPALAAALPLVLRHHAGDVEAPRRRARQWPRRGQLGRRGLPYLLAFQVVLPLLAPVVDSPPSTRSSSSRAPTIVVRSGSAFLGAAAASAPRTPSGWTASALRPLWSLPLQQFVYRQLMYLVVIQSVASALYGIRLRWQAMHRTGDLDDAPVAKGLI